MTVETTKLVSEEFEVGMVIVDDVSTTVHPEEGTNAAADTEIGRNAVSEGTADAGVDAGADTDEEVLSDPDPNPPSIL